MIQKIGLKMQIPPFKTFQELHAPQNKGFKILSFDPGETVGWAVLNKGSLETFGQIRTTEFKEEQINKLTELVHDKAPDIVVYESYRIYAWMTKQHSWDEVHTAQIIGILRYIALMYEIPYRMQSAQVAKQFVTDQKLKAWGMYPTAQKHAKDAVRHAVYWSLFGSLETSYGPEGKPKK